LAAASYDPFHNQKEEAFVKSMASVVEIAAAVEDLIHKQEQQQQKQQQQGHQEGQGRAPDVGEGLDHVLQVGFRA
jgi:hypothetical protein